MKNRIFVLSTLAVAALALVSCAKEQEISIGIEPKGVPFEIVASSIDTKTVNDDMSTLWEAGDQINLFHAVSGETTYVNDGAFEATADGASVSFTGTLASALSDGNYNWYAVYPYAAAYDSPDGSATINIPAAQTQTGNDSKAHLVGANCPVAGNVKTVAHDATPTVAFKHLTTIIKVHVINKTAAEVTVDGVSFAAPININGSFSLALTGDSPVLSGAGSSTTTALTVSGADALAVDGSADYYLAVKPFAVSAGQEISLTVSTDAGNQTLTSVMPSNYTFAVGKIATLNFNYTNKAVSFVRFKYNDADWLDAQTITKPAAGAGTGLDGSLQKEAPVYVAAQKKTGSAPMLWNDGGDYEVRLYNNNKLVIGSFNDKMITKVSFVGAAPSSADVGTLTASSKTWTGKAGQIVFSLTATTKIKSVTVFYEDADDSVHSLVVPTTAYTVDYDATSLTFPIFVSNTTGLSATSGSTGFTSATPSVANGEVTVAFTANAGYTPRDIVVKVASTTPDVSTDVTITQRGAPLTSIAGIKGLYSDAAVPFTATLTDALVTVVSGNTFFMEDASGGIKGNFSGHGLAVGNKISGTVTGTVTKSNGNYQLSALDKSSATVTTGNTVTPTTLSAATLSSGFASYESMLVKVEGVEVSAVSSKNLTLDGIDGFIVYNNSNLTLPVGSQFNAVGPATYYNSTKEIAVYTVEEADRISIVPTITANNQSVSVGGNVSVGATTNSTGAISYSSLNTGIATVVSGTGVVTGVSAGNATIRVSVAANGYWAAGSKDITVTVSAKSYTWAKVSSLSDITAGEYVIINNNKYLPSTTTGSSPVQADAPTITDNKIADANVTAAMKWTFSGTYSAMNVTNSAGKYLCINGKNNTALRVTDPTNPSNTWVFAVNSTGFSMKYYDTNTTPEYRYCATYSPGSDWRTYNSATAANYGDSGILYLYKKTEVAQ